MEISKSWACDPYYYSKDQYEQLLDNLSEPSKNNRYFVRGDYVTVAGRINQIWQRLRGLFGLENHTSSSKATYHLLKLIRHGASRNHFQDEKIRRKAVLLKSQLEKQKRWRTVAKAIDEIIQAPSDSPVTHLASINKTLKDFSKKKRRSLRPSLWNRLLSSPQPYWVTSSYHLNDATASFHEKRYSEAAQKASEALKLSQADADVAWKSRWLYATCQLKGADTATDENRSIEQLSEALELLEGGPDNPEKSPSLNNLRVDLLNKKASLLTQQAKHAEALDTLDQAASIDPSLCERWRLQNIELIQNLWADNLFEDALPFLRQVIHRSHLTEEDLAQILPYLFIENRFEEINLIAAYCRDNGVVMDFIAPKARQLFEIHKNETALSLLAFAMDLDTDSTHCRQQLISITFQLIAEALAKNDKTAAIAYLDQLNDSVGLHLDEMRHLIHLLEERGFPLATQEFADHLHLNSLEAHQALSRIDQFMASGDWAQAIEQAQSFVDNESLQPDTLWEGRSLLTQALLKEAQKAIDEGRSTDALQASKAARATLEKPCPEGAQDSRRSLLIESYEMRVKSLSQMTEGKTLGSESLMRIYDSLRHTLRRYADDLLGWDRVDEAIQVLLDATNCEYHPVAQDFYSLALALEKGEQTREAVQAMTRAIQLEPWNPQYHLDLGQLRQRLNLPFLENVKEAYRRNPNAPPYAKAYAKAMSDQAATLALDDPRHLQLLRRALQILKESHLEGTEKEKIEQQLFQDLQQAGTCALQEDKPMQAVALFEEAGSLMPQEDSIKMNLAQSYYKAGNAKKAVLLFNQIITRNPSLLSSCQDTFMAASITAGDQCFNQKRWLRSRSGDMKQAIAYYNQARELCPEPFNPYLGRLIRCHAHLDDGETLALFQEIKSSFPEAPLVLDEHTWVILAKESLMNDQMAQAANFFEKALQCNVSNRQAKDQLGEIYRQLAVIQKNEGNEGEARRLISLAADERLTPSKDTAVLLNSWLPLITGAEKEDDKQALIQQYTVARAYTTRVLATDPSLHHNWDEMGHITYNRAAKIREHVGLIDAGMDFSLSTECFQKHNSSEAHRDTLYQAAKFFRTLDNSEWETLLRRWKSLGGQHWQHP